MYNIRHIIYLKKTSHTSWYSTSVQVDLIAAQLAPFSYNNRYSRICSINPEGLSKLWIIHIDIARNTIKVTSFSSIRTHEGRISRRFRTDTYQRRDKRLGGSNARFYTDTLFSKVKGITGETCTELYTNGVGFTKLYPLIMESKAHVSLNIFIHEVCIPHELHSDNVKALIQGDYRKKVNK